MEDLALLSKGMILLLVSFLIFSIGTEVFLYNLPNTATGYSLFEEVAMERAKNKAEKDCPGYEPKGSVTNGYSAMIVYECKGRVK